MLSDPWFYATAIPAMILIGLAKGGFGSLSGLTVPLMTLTISPVQAAAITLPVLVLSDIVALASYWRQWDRSVLVVMLPGAMVGIAVGWITAESVTDDAIKLILGAISVAFALDYWLRRRSQTEPQPPNVAKGLFWGAISGFTSFVSHAGGPPFQVYAAPLGLHPRTFAATSVVFFATLNAVKLPPYFFLNQFTADNLLLSAVLMPVSITATLFGVWLVRRIDPKTFYAAVYVLIFLVGLFLIGEGVIDLAA